MRDTSATVARRAAAFAAIRSYFAAHAVTEVDTPALARSATPDPNLHSLETRLSCAPESAYYLHTSPEFAMKKLIADGCGDIYQIAHVFRNGELGKLHQPEFCLLEWYRLGWDERALANETVSLIALLASDAALLDGSETGCYRDLFLAHAGLDPLAATTADLETCAADHGIGLPEHIDRPQLLDLVMGTLVAPQLGFPYPCVVLNYPAEQAALAELTAEDPRLAARFEVFWRGVELANGFRELRNSTEQRRRFAAELAIRERRGLPTVPVDTAFLDNLDQLPPCSGVALGIDRLLMLIGNHDSIADVMTLPVLTP